MQAIAYNYIHDPVGRKMQMERYVKDHEPLILMLEEGAHVKNASCPDFRSGQMLRQTLKAKWTGTPSPPKLPILRDVVSASRHHSHVACQNTRHGASSLPAFHLRGGPSLPFAHEAGTGIAHIAQETTPLLL